MEIKLKVLPPTMPNFITLEKPVGKRQDGIKPESGIIPIVELTEEQANEYADLMKQEFIKYWKFMKEQSNNPRT